MKALLLISALLMTSCASRPGPRAAIEPLRPPAVEPVEAVRYAEVVRAYHVSRYVDPNEPWVMHEQHSVYRVEAQSRWNLRPGPAGPVPLNPLNPPVDAAYAPGPTNDVVLAELNRQKDATERVMWEATQLARSYDELQKVIGDMTRVAKNNTFMGARLAHAEGRVAALEQEYQQLSTPPTPDPSAVPPIFIDEPDPPTP